MFIHSKNKWTEEVSEDMREMTINEKTKSRIMIATSVMDNGINLKDNELRNIVLMADTETEFIQMLGRKRKDGEKVKLYICKYNRNHFEERLKGLENRLSIANDYVEKLIECERRNKYENEEDKVIMNLHIKLMRDLSDGRITIKDAGSLFNVYGGLLYLNLLSYENLKNLNKFYKKVIGEFDKNGEDAFVKMQLGWLDVIGEKADKIIQNSRLSYLDKYIMKINEILEQKNGKELDKQEAIDLKMSMLKPLEELFKNIGDVDKPKDIKRNDRPLSGKWLEVLKSKYGIKYKITESKGKYTISKDDSAQESE